MRRQWGQIGPKFTFSEHGHIDINLKEIRKCSSKVANICLEDTYPLAPTLGMGSEGQNSTFQNMVMLHIKIKENHECSNVIANIWPADPPPPPPPPPPNTPTCGWDQ